MTMVNTIFQFVLFSLACWRITHLLSKEDGPFDIIYKLRKKAGAGFLGSLLDCFYCVSIWVALPSFFLFGNTWYEKIIYWLATSGLVCLLEQATTKKYISNNVGKKATTIIPDYKED
jgi:hypothetical protein